MVSTATNMAIVESIVPRRSSPIGYSIWCAEILGWARLRSFAAVLSANGEVAEMELDLALSQTQCIVSV